jgi:hypothetical protein
MNFRKALNGTQSQGSQKAKIGVSHISLTAASGLRSSDPKLYHYRRGRSVETRREVYLALRLKHAEHFEDDDDNNNDSDDVEDASVHGSWITHRYPCRQAIWLSRVISVFPHARHCLEALAVAQRGAAIFWAWSITDTFPRATLSARISRCARPCAGSLA